MNMESFICRLCSWNNNEDAGPFNDNEGMFPRIKKLHANCRGWKRYIHEPTIEEIATKVLIENWDNWIECIKNTKVNV